jgi:cytoskeleton protein RodZ
LPSATATPDASGARIVIRATDESWVQVRDADRNPIMTRVLARGDVYRVPNRPGLTLQAGNAGALEILVDGLAVPSIGPVGSVRRDVLLEPDRLRAGAILNTDR